MSVFTVFDVVWGITVFIHIAGQSCSVHSWHEYMNELSECTKGEGPRSHMSRHAASRCVGSDAANTP